jgi:ankyrin repeat protein
MPLWSAAEAGRTPCVQYLVQHPPSCYYLNWPDSNGDTPLHAAGVGNHSAAATAICAGIAASGDASKSAEAVLHAVNAKGYTPAHVSTGKTDMRLTSYVCMYTAAVR